MHIVRIELENIKSHASSAYDFELGTTAITGENGAGKTTIIEAIAWVLFDLLDYKKEDFLRRGEKKGLVRGKNRVRPSYCDSTDWHSVRIKRSLVSSL